MLKRDGGIKIFSVILIMYGALTLIGNTGYADFTSLCQGLPRIVIIPAYIFGISYGVMAIVCGARILRREDWARRTAVVFVFISLVLGLFITPCELRNLEAFYSARPETANLKAAGVIQSYAAVTFILTTFEILFVFYFTRPYIRERFIEA